MADAENVKSSSKPLPAAGDSGNGGSSFVEFSRVISWILDSEASKETLRIAKIHSTDPNAPASFPVTFSHPVVERDRTNGYSVPDGGFYKFPG